MNSDRLSSSRVVLELTERMLGDLDMLPVDGMLGRLGKAALRSVGDVPKMPGLKGGGEGKREFISSSFCYCVMEASAILLVVLSPDPPQENGSNTKYYFTWVVGRILCHLAILMKHL